MGCGYRVRGKAVKPKTEKDKTEKSEIEHPRPKFKWQYAVIAVLLVAIGFMLYRLINESRLARAEFEQTIANIHVMYEDIQNGIQTNAYQKVEQQEGVFYYYDESGELKCVYVMPGVNGSAYGRMLFYDDGAPFFAYYEQEDAHSLYFKDDELIRWRYCADKDNPSDGVNQDLKRTDGYVTMESQILKEAYSYLQ